ncbi:hypothetical protein [Longimicrobium sp.]|jgi:hypothetical protein|uniref:hypothetical protein n=1 Tax=Longimicrobium sp. TaxID=2029185 RepID=UPI002ED94802
MSLRAWVLAALLALPAGNAVAQARVPRLATAPGTAYFVVPSPGAPDSVWFGWSWPQADPLSAQLFEQGSQARLTPFAGAAPAPRQAQAVRFPAVAVGPQGELWLLQGEGAAEWLTLLDAAEATLRRGGQRLPGTQLRGVNDLGRFGRCTVYSAPPLAPLGGDTGRVRLPTLRATAAASPTAFPVEVTPGEEVAVPRYSRWLVADGRPCTPGPADTLRLFRADTAGFFLTLTGVQVGAADVSNGPWPNWVPGVRRRSTGPGPFAQEIVLKAADLPQPGVGGTDLCAAEVFRAVCSWDRALRRGVYTVSDSMGNRAGPLAAAVRASCASLLAGVGSCGSVGDRLWRTRTGITAAWGYGGVLVLSAAPRIESRARDDSLSWIIAAALADSLATARRLVLGTDTLTVRVVPSRPPGWSLAELIVAGLIVLVSLLGAAYLHSRHRDTKDDDLRSRLYRALVIEAVRSTAPALTERSQRAPLDVVAFGWALADPTGLPARRGLQALRLPRREKPGAALHSNGKVVTHFDQLLRFDRPATAVKRDLWGASPAFLVLGGRYLAASQPSSSGKKQQWTEARDEVVRAAGTAALRAARPPWRDADAEGATRWAAHLALGAELAGGHAAEDGVLRAVLTSEMVPAAVRTYLYQLEKLPDDVRTSPAVWVRLGREARGAFGPVRRSGAEGGDAGDDAQPGPLHEELRRAPWLAVLLGFWSEQKSEEGRARHPDLSRLADEVRVAGGDGLPAQPRGIEKPEAALLLGWWLVRQPAVGASEALPHVEDTNPPEVTLPAAATKGADDTRNERYPERRKEGGGTTTGLAPEHIDKLLERELKKAEESRRIPEWVSSLDRLLDRTAAASVRHTAEQNLNVRHEALNAREERLEARENSLVEGAATVARTAAEVRLIAEHLAGFVEEVLTRTEQRILTELRGLPSQIHQAVETRARSAVDDWKGLILDAAQKEAAERVRTEWAPYQTRIEQILPDLTSPEAERSAQLLRELHGHPGLLRDLLSLRSRVTDHTWSLLVNPADAALAEDHRQAGADAVQPRVNRVVNQIQSLPGDGQTRVQEVLVNVDVLARWAEQLWRALLVPAVNDRVAGLSDAARAEWDQSYRALLHFVVNHAGAYSRLLSTMRGGPDGRAERPLLVDAEVLRGLDGTNADIAGRLRMQLLPPERLGELDRVVLAIQYLTEAFPLEQLERIRTGLGDSLLADLQDRLSRAGFAPRFHDLVRGISEPLGLEYRPVVYYQSSIDAPAFRFIDREVSRISLSQRLGYEARPGSETLVVRLERPFFFDAVHKHYYAGFAHVARP